MIEVVERFFKRQVCQKATGPLSAGAMMSLQVDAETFTLRKEKTGLAVLAGPCEKPDLSFSIPLEALKQLDRNTTEDVGEMGVALLKQMIQSDPKVKMHAKVHIGIFDLLRKGYLGVLPLGGPAVMKFLGTKGFTNMSKIKEAIQKMRTEK